MWRCFVRDQARVPSVAGAGSSLFRKTEQFCSHPSTSRHTAAFPAFRRALAHTRALQRAGSPSTIGPLDAHFELYSAKGRT